MNAGEQLVRLLSVSTVPNELLQCTNYVYISSVDTPRLYLHPSALNYVKIKTFVYMVAVNEQVRQGTIALNRRQRQDLNIFDDYPIDVAYYDVGESHWLIANINFEIKNVWLSSFCQPLGSQEMSNLCAYIHKYYIRQFFSLHQHLSLTICGRTYVITVESLSVRVDDTSPVYNVWDKTSALLVGSTIVAVTISV